METVKPDLTWLDEPGITQVGRLEPTASLHRKVPCAHAVQSLNGTWKALVSSEPDVAHDFEDEVFIQPEDNISHYDDIQVPGHLQLQGYGQIQYTNTAYPWDGKEIVPYGKTPKENLHARYALDFDVDEALARDHVELVFHGVESAFYVWLNGTFIGYSTDSFTPSAFDVTGLLKDKDNRLSVLVYQFSSGSWLEDQDFFRFSGIFRDVELQGRKKAWIEDLRITTELADDFSSGAVIADIRDRNANRFTISLFDPDEKLMFAQTITSRSLRLFFDDVRLWSAERPDLYTLRIDVLDEDGAVQETVEEKVGMRRIEIVDGVALLNGRRLMLHGVNRHEFSSKTGRVLTEEEIRNDLLLMKANNINAVRTCHYPNREVFYDLADELGLYVMDEANLETHGTWQSGFTETPDDPLPGNKPEWKKAVLERAQAMFERDKNHPSILFWSLGNESWYGDNLLEEAAWLRIADPDRLIHYESCFRSDDYAGCTDVYSRMYATPEEIEKILKSGVKKPVILCEYMHGMGNSLGGMYRYARLEEYRHYQGGFLWDFADQAIETEKNGVKMLGYGGDFGDFPNNGNFSGNGILFADHTPSAKMQEVRALFAPMRIIVDEDGAMILNTSLFTGTDQYRFAAIQKMEDRVIYEEEFYVDIHPGRYGHVDLDWIDTKEESVCTVSALLAEDQPWAEAGHEIAFGQNVLSRSSKPHPIEEGMQFVQGKEYFGASFNGIRFLFNQKGLASISNQGVEWLEAMPRPVFSHAYTDNERGFEFDRISSVWYGSSLFTRTVDRQIALDESGQFARVTYHMALPYPASSSTQITLSYFISAPGFLGIRMEMPGNRYMPDLPVFGMEFKLPKSADQFEYYGCGPLENYRDRKCGAKLDVFQDNAADNVQPYLKPQETGNRADVRWIEFRHQGQILRFEQSDRPFEVSVLPYSFAQLQDADHQEELPASTGTYVRIASDHMGVGGIDSWGYEIHSSDRLSASKTRSLSFVLSFTSDEEKQNRLEQPVEERTQAMPETEDSSAEKENTESSNLSNTIDGSAEEGAIQEDEPKAEDVSLTIEMETLTAPVKEAETAEQPEEHSLSAAPDRADSAESSTEEAPAEEQKPVSAVQEIISRPVEADASILGEAAAERPRLSRRERNARFFQEELKAKKTADVATLAESAETVSDEEDKLAAAPDNHPLQKPAEEEAPHRKSGWPFRRKR